MPTKALTVDARRILRGGAVVAAALLTGCVSPTLEVATGEDVERLSRVMARTTDSRAHSVTRAHALELVASPLEFTGRVVDGAGRGIAGAMVQIHVFDRVLDPFHFPYFGYSTVPIIETQQDGLFELRAYRGVGLHVDVRHPDYVPLDLPHRTYQSEHVLPTAEYFEMPEPDAPATFTLREATAADQLREIATGAISFDGAGEPIEVSLHRINPYGELPGTGDLSVSCMVADTQRHRYPWSCRIRVTGGGVQLQNTVDFFQAPTEGYAPEIDVGYTAEDEKWSDRVDEGVFVKLASGHFGFLRFKVRTRGDQYFVLQGRLNEVGSRRLE